jgi:hypothetical protein
MTTRFHNTEDFLGDSLLDRLVDGELSDHERRELLLRLGTEPDGWRRCAVAFLEAQSWRATFRPLVCTGRDYSKAAIIRAGRHAAGKRGHRVFRLASLAASFAAMFVLGWALRGGFSESRFRAPASETQTPPPAAGVAREQLSASAATEGGLAELRAREDQTPFSLWEQEGYRAERQRQLISMELKDGRRLEVPIQEVRVHYVGSKTY